MNINKFFHWLPRILGIAFVLFISLFALDVFEEYKGLETIIGFLIHLLPSLILLAAVVVAWKYELVGAVVFFIFAVFYIFMVGLNRPFSWYLCISLPSAVVGVLYLKSWKNRLKINHKI
jgi:hypothetical protein